MNHDRIFFFVVTVSLAGAINLSYIELGDLSVATLGQFLPVYLKNLSMVLAYAYTWYLLEEDFREPFYRRVVFVTGLIVIVAFPDFFATLIRDLFKSLFLKMEE